MESRSESPDRIATDATCRGFCRCPRCGGGARWSPPYRLHACADPACAFEFKEHNATPFERPGELFERNTNAALEDGVKEGTKATRDGDPKTKRRDPTFTPRRRVGPHR